jgi:archaellin
MKQIIPTKGGLAGLGQQLVVIAFVVVAVACSYV